MIDSDDSQEPPAIAGTNHRTEAKVRAMAKEKSIKEQTALAPAQFVFGSPLSNSPDGISTPFQFEASNSPGDIPIPPFQFGASPVITKKLRLKERELITHDSAILTTLTLRVLFTAILILHDAQINFLDEHLLVPCSESDTVASLLDQVLVVLSVLPQSVLLSVIIISQQTKFKCIMHWMSAMFCEVVARSARHPKLKKRPVNRESLVAELDGFVLDNLDSLDIVRVSTTNFL